MKNIYKKVAEIILPAVFVVGMLSCSNDSMNNSALPSALNKETVAIPEFSVASGEVENGTELIITCATEGAKIYYTTDGKAPTALSTEYIAAINVIEAVTIKAIAVKDGMSNSVIASVGYTLKDFPLIPAGTFLMGSNQGYDDNKPVHKVTITKAFYMCDHEVTRAEYEAIINIPWYGNYHYPVDENLDNYPVLSDWYSAIIYCNKRSMAENLTPCYAIYGKTDPAEWGPIPDPGHLEMENITDWEEVVCDWNANGYRLPTEAEWEYAARAGDMTVDYLTWSGTNVESCLWDYSWYYPYDSWNNPLITTHEVKKKRANAFGLYDMSGNVWEWCWDWFPASGAYSAAAVTDPRGDSSVTGRICRGGSYNLDSGHCAVSCRQYFNPFNGKGFRVCRTSLN